MKVLFVSSGKDKGMPGPIIQMQGDSLVNRGIELKHFTVCKKGIRGYLAEILRLKKFLKDFDFDIIHAHYGFTAIAAQLAKSNEKLIVSFMGDDLIGSNRSNGSITFKSIIIARVNIWLSECVYDFSIVKSQEMMNKINSSKSRIIPNGVDIDFFRPVDKSYARQKLGINTMDKIVIFVSDPARVEKNFNLARQAIQRSGINNISLIPVHRIPSSELVYYYCAADALILTSFHEGSPNVVKEAMSCCCPVVSTDVGDVSWLFGSTPGHYLSSFNPDDFAEKIREAIEYREKYGITDGREKIEKLGLSSAEIAEEILKIYNMLLITRDKD